jgi:UDP-N-acetylmuramoyl-tripeptide--D-alanyl-D-alanine ligase
MYRHCPLNDKLFFANLEDAIKLKTKNLKSCLFINRDDADVSITSVKANCLWDFIISNITISSHLIGLYNASNLYAAITIGKYFEVDELL